MNELEQLSEYDFPDYDTYGPKTTTTNMLILIEKINEIIITVNKLPFRTNETPNKPTA